MLGLTELNCRSPYWLDSSSSAPGTLLNADSLQDKRFCRFFLDISLMRIHVLAADFVVLQYPDYKIQWKVDIFTKYWVNAAILNQKALRTCSGSLKYK